ncbi:Arm DNA-binding domain-containing protein [Bradyrhizobium barranii]|uniref:Arm DNA-binding domain-containing protein n=1 Tax=Bradyrhizobium TaxID=374 RepID=UPI0031FCED0B
MTQPLKSDQRKLFAFSQCRHHLLSQQQQRRRSLPRHRDCKNWCYRYWKEGKPRWLGLGSLKDVSLKDARLVRDAARLRVKGDRSAPGVDIVWRSERRLRKRKPERPRSPCLLSSCAPKSTCASTGRSGARSIAFNGRRRSNGTLTRQLETHDPRDQA